MRLQSLILLPLLVLAAAASSAQQKRAGAQEKSLVMQGNRLYSAGRYKEAQDAYQQALQRNPSFVPGAFNLGNTLIQQKQYEAARKLMAATAKNAREKSDQSGANYNIGNTYMSEQKWSNAADAYKQALRKNPQDADAKYNLSYALARMKQDQNNKDKNKDKNKDQKKDKEDDQKKGDQDKKDQDKKNGKDQQDQNKNGDQSKQQDQKDGGDQGEKNQGKRPEPQPSKLSQQQADNLLKALQQEERKLQDRKNQGKGIPVKMEKDW